MASLDDNSDGPPSSLSLPSPPDELPPNSQNNSSTADIDISELAATDPLDAVPLASSGAKRRALRIPPSHMPPDLPATAVDVKDLTSFSRVVSLLSVTIIKATQDGKSVTASNKRLIVAAAAETQRAMNVFQRLTPLPMTSSEPRIEASTSEVISADVAEPIATVTSAHTSDASQELKSELSSCISEIRKLRGDLAAAKNVLSPPDSTMSYANIAKRPALKRADARPPAHTNTSLPPPPLMLPSTKPALVVSTKTPVGTRQEVVEAFRNSISFRETKYAPSKVAPISKNKLRVEFDSAKDCEDALMRLRTSTSAQVVAEPVKKLKPMIILKGISMDMSSDDLVEVVLAQNVELENCTKDDISLKFKRNNRNSKLYNAIFVVSPQLYRTAVPMGRIRVDHQRVHIEEFSPFLQCHRCLQFGHVNKHCRSEQKRCAHCSETTHVESDCPTRADKHVLPKCFNCLTHNSKFPNKLNVAHKATSLTCPILRNIRDKVNNTIDYGCTQ